MIKRIKEYLEYRKNRKAARKAFAKLAASILPALAHASAKSADIVNLIIRLADTPKDISGERLVGMVLSEMSDALQTDNEHIIEILTYMAALKPEDIRKILIHSAVETMPDNTGKNNNHQK